MASEKPRYPVRSLSSRGVLLRPLQDIDVYVEDDHSEVFYNALLNRVFGDLVRFFSVIPLDGRPAVEAKAAVDDGSRPALYLVDGDLDWVAGRHECASEKVYIHQCYCVENYLFCASAMEVILHENSGRKSEDEVRRELDWAAFCSQLEMLVPLFIEFAVSHVLDTGIPTVSRGYGSVIVHPKGGAPVLDSARIDALIHEVRDEILARVDEGEYLRLRKEVEEHVSSLDRPLRVVSGKDFLLPLQNFEAHRVAGQRMKTESLMLRLAKHCDLAPLAELRNACAQCVG